MISLWGYYFQMGGLAYDILIGKKKYERAP